MAAPIPAQLGFLAIYNPSLLQQPIPALANSTTTSPPSEYGQIVYYATLDSLTLQQAHRRHRRRRSDAPGEPPTPAERDEQLRQVGLARGVVEFGAGFAGGAPVEFVETEQTRVLHHELEPGWWIVASIDLGRVPLPPRLPTSSTAAGSGADATTHYEYTSRDLKPAQLLLQDLLRAHSVFLLHHDSSLSALLERARRPRFAALLARYWDLFLATWSVVLRGNPARDVLGGINVAAGGELGVGVGEEHRGSGEREVLEGLVGRVEGLLDLVVSRFGDGGPSSDHHDRDRDRGVLRALVDGPGTGTQHAATPSWLGSGLEPAAEDGVVFAGVGGVSRKSLRDVSHWVEDLYTWGANAYGVLDGPTPTPLQPRRHRRKTTATTTTTTTSSSSKRPPTEEADQSSYEAKSAVQQPQDSQEHQTQTPALTQEQVSDAQPGPSDLGNPEMSGQASTTGSGGTDGFGPENTGDVVGTAAEALAETQVRTETETETPTTTEPEPEPQPKTTTETETTQAKSPAHSHDSPMGRITGYLKMGYGTYWSLGSGTSSPAPGSSPPNDYKDRETARAKQLPPSHSHSLNRLSQAIQDAGYFLIGLTGSMDDVSTSTSASTSTSPDESDAAGDDARTMVRILYVELESADSVRDLDDHHRKTTKVRVVVYVNRPFIFAFLFRPRTGSLARDSLYQSLHHQLAPLRRPLLASTTYRPPRPGAGTTSEKGFFSWSSSAAGGGGIHDLVWDPQARTVHCTIPNIPPSPLVKGQAGGGSGTTFAWTRAEAINTHAHVLSLFAATRPRGGEYELERTCKTNRGWWIVWMRILGGGDSSNHHNYNNNNDNEDDVSERPLSQVVEEVGEKALDADPDDDDGDAFESVAGSDRTARPVVVDREIFLLRHASDHLRHASVGVSVGGSGDVRSRSGSGSRSRSRSGSFAADGLGGGGGDGVDMGGTEVGESAGRLMQGIGVDTRRYIELLLSLRQ